LTAVGYDALVESVRLIESGFETDRFLRYALLCAAREVVALDLGQRPRPVPRHGRLLVVWTDRAPVVRALGRHGEELASAEVVTNRPLGRAR